jgi:TusA-related sulfurtransferase
MPPRDKYAEIWRDKPATKEQISRIAERASTVHAHECEGQEFRFRSGLFR